MRGSSQVLGKAGPGRASASTSGLDRATPRQRDFLGSRLPGEAGLVWASPGESGLVLASAWQRDFPESQLPARAGTRLTQAMLGGQQW